MRLTKNAFAFSILTTALAIAGCGGSGSDSSAPKNNTGAQNNSNQSNTSGSNNNNSQFDLYLDKDRKTFTVVTDYNYSNQPYEFAILYDGDDKNIAYRTKGFTRSDFFSSFRTDNDLVLTKTKLFKQSELEDVISHKSGEYTVGSKDGLLSMVTKYKVGQIAGEKVLSDAFLLNSGLNEEMLYRSDKNATSKLSSFLEATKKLNQAFPAGSYCTVLTQIEFKQPNVEFKLSDGEIYEGTLDNWISSRKANGERVKTDTFAGYRIAYVEIPTQIIPDYEAVVEYQGKAYYGAYNPATTIEYRKVLESVIKTYEDEIKQNFNNQTVLNILQLDLENQKKILDAFNNNKLCTGFNSIAGKEILNALKTIEQF